MSATSESVAMLQQHIRDLQTECGRLHAEKMMLTATVAALQIEVSACRAAARDADTRHDNDTEV